MKIKLQKNCYSHFKEEHYSPITEFNIVRRM